MFSFLQNEPIVIEVLKQPEPAPDISIQVVLGMFKMAGIVLAAAAVGGIIVGSLIILYRRYRDSTTPPTDSDHTRLKI